jgi:D-tyrosyl-tRNA(Tyr) deacylase
MRAVLQRVLRASVRVDGEVVASIGKGLLVLLGIGKNDQEEDIHWMTDKLIHLRIFEDQQGKMNHSLSEIGGEILLVSQFTLYGDCRKGRRPNFEEAAPVEKARFLYERMLETLKRKGVLVQSGVFQAKMEVELVNDGPVTLLLETPIAPKRTYQIFRTSPEATS